MARVLIVGCGYVGTELAGLLARAGHDVHGMRREAQPVAEGVRLHLADVTRWDGIGGLPPRLDFVVYCVSAGGRDEARYRAAYIDGLGNVLRALREEGQSPQRVLFTSSTSVYAQTRDEWVDEESPTHPPGFAGQIQLAAEGLLAGSPYPGTTVRLGGIYGPGRSSTIDRMRANPVIPDSADSYYTNRIHRDDAARVLAHLIECNAPAPLYLGVDCEPARTSDIARWLADALGVDAREGAAEAGSRGSGSKRCRNDLLLSTGFRFLYPTFREGYKALIESAAADEASDVP